MQLAKLPHALIYDLPHRPVREGYWVYALSQSALKQCGMQLFRALCRIQIEYRGIRITQTRGLEVSQPWVSKFSKRRVPTNRLFSSDDRKAHNSRYRLPTTKWMMESIEMLILHRKQAGIRNTVTYSAKIRSSYNSRQTTGILTMILGQLTHTLTQQQAHRIGTRLVVWEKNDSDRV